MSNGITIYRERSLVPTAKRSKDIALEACHRNRDCEDTTLSTPQSTGNEKSCLQTSTTGSCPSTSSSSSAAQRRERPSLTSLRRSSSSRVSFSTIEIFEFEPGHSSSEADDDTNKEESKPSANNSFQGLVSYSGNSADTGTIQIDQSTSSQSTPNTFTTTSGDKKYLDTTLMPETGETGASSHKTWSSSSLEKGGDIVDEKETLQLSSKPIKCGLETYEKIRPPRRSRTEFLLDSIRERNRRKLSHNGADDYVEKLEYKCKSQSEPERAMLRHVSESGNLTALKRTKRRRSCDNKDDSEEYERIETSESGKGLKGWSNIGASKKRRHSTLL